MKIAFVALPQPNDGPSIGLAPPLPLGYLAALLEQQRHIVRIYDMGLGSSVSLESIHTSLRAFKPNLVAVTSGTQEIVERLEVILSTCNAAVMYLSASLREAMHGCASVQAAHYQNNRSSRVDEEIIILEALRSLENDLDSLPYPARHLLPLEQYQLFTPTGDRQTTVIVAQRFDELKVLLRQPVLIAAELHSIVREHGLRHFVFAGSSLTYNMSWLDELLQHLVRMNVPICWEAHLCYEMLDQEWLQRLHRAGCTILCFEFAASDALLSKDKRTALLQVIQLAHAFGMHVRARIKLETPYSAMPGLIDTSASFSIDDVQFFVPNNEHKTSKRTVQDEVPLEEFAEMVRSRYRYSRSRQAFVKRFGPQLGPVLWRVGRIGLLGQTWQRYASGDDNGLAYQG